MNISEEWGIFVSAVCSGVFLYSSYYAVVMIRNLGKHPLWLVNLEDVIYWCLIGGYLFVQIYHTNNGIIRGYYILGVVLGALISWKIFQKIKKMWKKFVHAKKEKNIDNLK